MNYKISLYSVNTKILEESSDDELFFEHVENLVPFSEEEFQSLKNRLQVYQYQITNENEVQIRFSNPDPDYGTALLTKYALHFSADMNENSIFEVGMTASEFTDTEHFAKYDFHNGGWENFD